MHLGTDDRVFVTTSFIVKYYLFYHLLKVPRMFKHLALTIWNLQIESELSASEPMTKNVPCFYIRWKETMKVTIK